MSQTLNAIGGIPPYTWTAIDTLPPGLSLSSAGVLSGSPATATAGAYYTIQVTDSASTTATLELWIAVLGVADPVPPVVEVLQRSLAIVPELEVFIQSPSVLAIAGMVSELEVTVITPVITSVFAPIVAEMIVSIADGSANTDLTNGAIGAWKFDNSLNDAVSTNSWICRYFDQNAGSIQSATPTYVSGYNGQGFSSSDTAASGVYGSFLQISIATGTALRIDNKAFTQAFVFRPQNSGAFFYPINYFNTSTNAAQMHVFFDGTKINFQYASTTGFGDLALYDPDQDVGLQTVESYSANKTYLVVIWNSPTGTAGLAVRNLTDGVDFTTVTATGKAIIVRTGGSNRFLLNRPDSGFFSGTWLDCLTMWSRLLTTAEITALASNPQYPFT